MVKGPSINLFLIQSMFEYFITFVFIVLFGLKVDKVFPLILFALCVIVEKSLLKIEVCFLFFVKSFSLPFDFSCSLTFVVTILSEKF